MGGGSRSGGVAREVAWRTYELTLRGDLPGLEPKLAKALREDSLSPRLRESLAATAREVSRNEYLVSRDEVKALKATAERVNARFLELVERDRKWVERFKPLIIPASDLRFGGRELLPEFTGTWIERKGRYIYVTYWFRFPYDNFPGDGPEYEPFTAIIDRYRSKVIEYHFRTHWKVMRVSGEDIVHEGGRPIIVFSDHGHTPIPLLTREARFRIMSKYPGVRSAWVLLHQLRRPTKLRNISVEVHIGPSRKEVSNWERNPLRKPWYEKL